MKHVFCVAMILFCVQLVYSQTNDMDTYVEEDYYTSIKDLREKERFRIGVDISTPLVGSLAGLNMRPRAALIFNLKTAPNRAWRFSPMYEQNRRFTDFNTSNYDVYQVNDTAIVYRNNYTEEYRVTGRIGTEWFKQYEKNTLVYGIDVVAGFGSELCSYTDSYVEYDQNGDVVPFTVGSGFFGPSDFYQEELIRLIVGVDFSIGYKVFLGEKADLTIEWIPEYTYRPYLKSNESGSLMVDSSPIQDQFVFDIRGFSIQLHYKFNKKD
ncbi:MAG: hypothetical protein AB8B53_00180 [Flavobacteriales bacterium]